MARKVNNQKVVVKASLGVCRDCAHHYDEHELTNYEPKHFFMCRCPFEKWSQFLEKECVNGKFKKIQ